MTRVVACLLSFVISATVRDPVLVYRNSNWMFVDAIVCCISPLSTINQFKVTQTKSAVSCKQFQYFTDRSSDVCFMLK